MYCATLLRVGRRLTSRGTAARAEILKPTRALLFPQQQLLRHRTVQRIAARALHREASSSRSSNRSQRGKSTTSAKCCTNWSRCSGASGSSAPSALLTSFGARGLSYVNYRLIPSSISVWIGMSAFSSAGTCAFDWTRRVCCRSWPPCWCCARIPLYRRVRRPHALHLRRPPPPRQQAVSRRRSTTRSCASRAASPTCSTRRSSRAPSSSIFARSSGLELRRCLYTRILVSILN